MYKILLCGVFYIVVSVCLGQSVTLLAEDSKEPVEGAVIISSDAEVYAISDRYGQAKNDAFKGKLEITIRALGYETKLIALDFSVKPNATIELTPALFNLDQVVVTASRWSQRVDNVPMKVITVDSDAPNSDRLYYIGTDNIAAGVQAGELLAEAVPEGGKVMIFVGDLTQANANERAQGVINALLGQD